MGVKVCVWCDLTMQKTCKLDVPALCASRILIPLNLYISFSVFRLPWERPCLAQNWISSLRIFSMVWRNQVIECAEYAIIYLYVLHFNKLDESSCVGFILLMSLREIGLWIHFLNVGMFQPYEFQASVHCESFIFLNFVGAFMYDNDS